jgi:hypothetical protein
VVISMLEPLIAETPSREVLAQRDYWADKRSSIRRENASSSSSPYPCSGRSSNDESLITVEGVLRPQADYFGNSDTLADPMPAMMQSRVSAGTQAKLQAWAARSKRRLGKRPITDPDGSIREGTRTHSSKKLQDGDGDGIMVTSRHGMGKVRTDEVPCHSSNHISEHVHSLSENVLLLTAWGACRVGRRPNARYDGMPQPYVVRRIVQQPRLFSKTPQAVSRGDDSMTLSDCTVLPWPGIPI